MKNCNRVAVTAGRPARLALFGSASALMLLAIAPGAHAQVAATAASSSTGQQPPVTSNGGTTLPELMVQARRTEEPIQKVPETVTALTQTELRVQNIQTTHDLYVVVPSLAVTQSYGVNTQTYTVRGLAGVVAYFSGVPFGGIQPTEFFDMSDVEFLNGAQGTLFGRSNVAGAILEEPQHPVMNDFGGFVDVQAGDYDHLQFQGAVNIPLIQDHLAMRFAMNSTRTEGYTSQFGYTYNTANGVVSVPASSEKLDGIDEQEYRLGVEFKAGGFDNYLMLDLLNEDGTPHSEVGGGIYPEAPELNSPYNLPATFFTFCTAAVADGLASSVTTCENAHAMLDVAARNELIAEEARIAAGGSIRETPAPYNGLDELAKNMEHELIDVAQYDFGDIGLSTHLLFKNTFGYNTGAGVVSEDIDGVGGLIEQDAGPDGQGAAAGGGQQRGNALVPETGNWVHQYYDEGQLQGDSGNGLLKWTAGAVVTYTPVEPQTIGPSNTYQIIQGIFTPNLGYMTGAGYYEGGFSREYGAYGFGTLDLSRWIHGLSFTAGYRYSWDTSFTNTRAGVINYPSGVFTPSPTITYGAVSNTAGYNYNFQLSEQVTDKWLVYATVARAYVPGAANGPSGPNAIAQGATIPNFTPTYQAESVMDYELGTKYDFTIGGMRGRLNADLYRYDHSNIAYATTFNAVVPSGTVLAVAYTENAGAAVLQGAELQGAIFPSDDWQISFNGSYQDDYYTNFVGSDPLGTITYATAGPTYGKTCLPGSIPNTAKSAGLCLLNLTGTGFAYAPGLKGNITVRYRAPLDEKYGPIWLTAVVFGQSRELFYPYSKELQQVLAVNGGNSNVNGWSQAPFATLNLRADWSNVLGSRWNAAFYIDNVTNLTYALSSYPQILTFGDAPKTYAPPIMFGAEVSTKF